MLYNQVFNFIAKYRLYNQVFNFIIQYMPCNLVSTSTHKYLQYNPVFISPHNKFLIIKCSFHDTVHIIQSSDSYITQYMLNNQLFFSIRYNDFQHDPLASCQCTPPYSGENGISARSDLNPASGTYPFGALGHRSHGGTDMKVIFNIILLTCYHTTLRKKDFENMVGEKKTIFMTSFILLYPQYFEVFFLCKTCN